MPRRKPASSATVNTRRRRKPATTSAPYSERWMGRFIAQALKTLDLPAVCREHEVSLADLVDYRVKDAAFNAAMIEVDRSLTLAIGEGLKARAAAGDGRATSLLLRRQSELDQLAGQGGRGSRSHRIPEQTAEIMVLAGLVHLGSLPAPPLCPLCYRTRKDH